MDQIGIIAEFNPLHTGHAHLIRTVRERYGKEAVITVIMSGSFVQRGEPAFFDKFDRTTFALSCGCDLVFELPTLYALSYASTFAAGAARLAASVGVSTLVCGSEQGSGSLYEKLARRAESQFVQTRLKEALNHRVSYGQALLTALQADDASSAPLLATPNGILAFSYAAAIRKYSLPEKLEVVYRNTARPDIYTSASQLRKICSERKNAEDCLSFIPPPCRTLFSDLIKNGKYINYERYDDAVLLQGRLLTESDLQSLAAFTEGLENRWHKVMKNSTSLTESLKAVKTKRYMYSRLRRMAAYTLLGIEKETATDYLYEAPPYARLLGASCRGREVLNNRRKSGQIPFITKFADADFKAPYKELLRLDAKATDIQHFLFHNPAARNGLADWKTPPVMT